MTIAETQINAIASSLIRAEPFVYYNDIPESETAGMADFKKLAEGQTATLPPFTIKQSIKITPAAPIDVHNYSKSAKSRYEFYKKVILRKLKKTIKVWSRRDNKLKGDCRVPERNIRLIKSPVEIAGHPTNIEADESNWIVSEPGNIFCFMDKPYARSQAAEPAMALKTAHNESCVQLKSKILHYLEILADNVFTFDYLSYREMPVHCCIAPAVEVVHQRDANFLFGVCVKNFLGVTAMKIVKCHSFYTNKIFSVLPVESQFCQILYLHRMQNAKIIMHDKMQIGPAQNNGKLLASDSPNDWANGAEAVTQPNGHSFAAALTNVVGPHANVKFLAYNNVPPAVPNVKTKSNSKGVIIISTAPGQNDGAWIVHTVPGFPAARTGYSWAAAEIAKGHLLICMTIAKTQINAIAASLFHAEPFVYYNDIPETETAGMPDFKKLAEGQIPTMPPFTITRSIKLTGAGAVPVHIYSKSAKSRYESSHNTFTNDFLEMYKKVILKGLKKTI
ncbi:Deoxyribonuclease-2-alpha, partial [Trichinella britovi]